MVPFVPCPVGGHKMTVVISHLIRGHLLITVSYLTHVREPMMKGTCHVGTLLWVPLQMGLTCMCYNLCIVTFPGLYFVNSTRNYVILSSRKRRR